MVIEDDAGKRVPHIVEAGVGAVGKTVLRAKSRQAVLREEDVRASGRAIIGAAVADIDDEGVRARCYRAFADAGAGGAAIGAPGLLQVKSAAWPALQLVRENGQMREIVAGENLTDEIIHPVADHCQRHSTPRAPSRE